MKTVVCTLWMERLRVHPTFQKKKNYCIVFNDFDAIGTRNAYVNVMTLSGKAEIIFMLTMLVHVCIDSA